MSLQRGVFPGGQWFSGLAARADPHPRLRGEALSRQFNLPLASFTVKRPSAIPSTSN